MATAPKAAAKSGPKAVEAAADAPAGKSRAIIFIAVIAVLLLAAGGGAAWYFVGHSASGGKESNAAGKHASAKPPVFMSLETFTVNLQIEESQQFLQVQMTLQVADDAQAELIKVNMPQVRNRLLLLLSSKKPSEILSVEGKQKLAAEIMEQVKLPFSPHGAEQEVSDVFFTSFVVQ